MDAKIKEALEKDRVIDITTTGRQSGLARRIEIWFHNIDGTLYITGRPGKRRDWYANMEANPNITFHLKQTTQADIPATVTPILDESARREVLTRILEKLGYSDENVDEWVGASPLVEVSLQLT
ncbi:MAG: DUF385 domain-containing protein [Chloroflexi bacterium]|nr:MAG: nitroreductase family deazaflavin-dependent oxidoreductase [Phototrophicales bacterium]RMF77245.1 MAG: DUF385 domain-containing protein [Chloroflexota bacterium]